MKIPNIIKNFFTYIIHNNNLILNKSINFIVLYIVLSLLFIFQPPEIRIDQVLKNDIIADQDIKYIDTEATKKREEVIKFTTPPVFINDYKIKRNQEKILTDFLQKIITSKKFDDIKILTEQNNIEITSNEYQNIKNINAVLKGFLNKIFLIYSTVYKNGLINLNESELSNYEYTGIIIGEYVNQQLKYTHYLTSEIMNKNKLEQTLSNEIENVFNNINENQKNILKNFLLKFYEPNVSIDEILTNERLNNRIRTESIVYKNIKKGEIIAKKGELITKNLFEKINFVLKNKREYFNQKNIFSILIFNLLVLIFLYLFLNSIEKKEFSEFKNYVFISIIIIINVLYFLIPIYLGYNKLSVYFGLYIPISAFSLSLMFLYSRIHSAFITTLLSILLFFITGFNSYALIFVFFSGVIIIFLTSQINRRIDLLFVSLIISLINILIYFFIIFSSNSNDLKLTHIILYSLCNGVVSSILSIGIINIGEIILNASTVFRLQELSHFSSPLLKKLFNTAIGTYNHSITVGNLAEAAAIEIGANALLAKIGGYYHDIGKMDNPEYFIENQKDLNKHNLLKPSISTAIIKAHVKIGIDKARKERLPQKVIDIISQHHGTTLIKFFYEEAIKKSEPDKKEIQKFDYQYQSENPMFPESAIVLLADQVEAATRALRKYTMNTLEKVIEKIINDKFQEGILDDSGLTLKNITKIKKIFIKVVTGMYHPRIEYPEQSQNEENLIKTPNLKNVTENNIK